MRNRIFLLEDDPNLSESVVEFLLDSGYDVVSAYSIAEAEEVLYEKGFDLLLLDVNVPDGDGFSLLKNLRENNNTTPAIFITSRNSVDDVEDGFSSGADDYIRKPFALKELQLRIQSIIKRNFFHNPNPKVQLSENIEYDLQNQILIIDGVVQNLQNKEHKLLKLFITNKNKLLSHDAIMEYLYDYDETPSDGSLRTYIKTLRKYLGKGAIVSHKRLGYQFC